MTILHAIVLGVVQGVTEFLPVSSSGHLILFPAVLGWPEQGMTFDVAVHLATLLAIVVAMRAELVSVAKGVVRKSRTDRALVAKLVVGTLPAVVVGFFLGDMLESIRSVAVVAWMLIIWGVLLAVADRRGKRKAESGKTGVSDVTWTQAMVIGVLQALALVPGTSRSGVTITGGLFMGLDRAQAARYTFLLAIPAILGAAAKTTWDVLHVGLDVGIAPLVVGFAAATISGILAIRFLLLLLRRGGFTGFAVYRIALGVTILLAFAF